MSDLKAFNRKEMQLEQIVNAIKGENVDETIADTNYNKWLYSIAKAIQENSSNIGAVSQVINEDKTNPVILKNLESGVYVLYGYFKANETTTNSIVAQVPLLASVSKTSSKTYIQLFFSYNNQIQYLEINDDDYTLTNIKLSDLVSRIEALESKVT